MQRFGLIGHPLKHSLSRDLFTKKFEYEGLDCRYQNFDLHSIEELKEVMESMGGFFEPWVAVSIVSIVVIFLLAPLLIIFVIFYFVNKNRKERYKLAQMAIQNGQPIPDEVLKGNTPNTTEESNDYTAGLRQIFLGIGLAIFLGFVVGKIGFGIGALVFCIGLGKVVIARKSGTNNDPLNNNRVDNYNNPSNNFNNE